MIEYLVFDRFVVVFHVARQFFYLVRTNVIQRTLNESNQCVNACNASQEIDENVFSLKLPLGQDDF